MDFYLGAEFIRTFGAVDDPDKNQLFVRAAGTMVDLEVASILESEGGHFSALGLKEMSEAQKSY